MRKYSIISVIIVSLIVSGALFAQDKKELIEKRTYHSKTFQKANGKYELQLSSGIIHYKDKDGKFKDIKGDFVSTAGSYAYCVSEGLFQADIKDDIKNKKAIRFADSKGQGIDFNIVSYGYYDQAKQEYRVIEFASNSKVRVEDNKATYKDVFEGVDVVYTYQNNRLKEDIYLTEQLRKELPNTKKFGFDPATTYLMVQSEIELDEGLNVSFASMDSGSFDIETHKRIDFVDHLGERLFYWPTDLAYVEGLPDDLEVEFEIPVLKRLYKQDEQIYLLAGIPVNWLNKIEKGVIVVDPTMVIQNPSQIQDAYVYKWLGDPNKANNNYGSSTVILWAAGTNNLKDTFYRSFIQFDFSVIPSNSRLTGAELYLTNDGYPHSGGNFSRYSISDSYIRRVTQKWDETTVTWNHQPEATTTHEVSIPAPTEADQSLDTDVTQLVRDILGSSEGNHGFLLRLQDETKYRGVRYASSNHADLNRWPKLTIEYELMNKAFYLKDHLGNIRVTVADDGTVISTDDYYPFGLQMPGRSYNVGFDRNIYKYSSKELDEEQFSGGALDWYYFGARYYDPEICRFLTIDPLQEVAPNMNPYHYCSNNPINRIDIMGLIEGHPDWDMEPIVVEAERYDPFEDIRKEILLGQINDMMNRSDKSDENDKSNSLNITTTANTVLGIVGSGSTINSYKYVFGSQWFHPGQNRWYSLGKIKYLGNVKSIVKLNTLLRSQALAFASKVAFWASVPFSAYGAYNYAISGQIDKAVFSIVDVAASASMTFGGPIGMSIGTIYYIHRIIYAPLLDENAPQWQKDILLKSMFYNPTLTPTCNFQDPK